MKRTVGLVLFTLLSGAVSDVRAGSFHWTSRGPLGGPLSSIAIDPSNASIAYAGSNNGGVFKTTDGGAHWTPSRAGLATSGFLSVNCVVVDPVHPSTLYAGLDGGLYKTVDAAAHWVSSAQGLPAEADIRAIAMDPTNPARLLTGERTTGVWESVDGGAHWSPRSSGMESDLFVLCLAIDPANPLNAFAGTNHGHLYRTVNGAGSWAPSQSGLPNGLGATSILIDPSSSTRMWAGTSDGVFRSADRAPRGRPPSAISRRSSRSRSPRRAPRPSSPFPFAKGRFEARTAARTGTR